MKVGDSFLVNDRRIDNIQLIVPGSEQVIIDVYTSFKDDGFRFENRETSSQLQYVKLEPISDLEAETLRYLPEHTSLTEEIESFLANPESSSDIKKVFETNFAKYLRNMDGDKPTMPELKKLLEETRETFIDKLKPKSTSRKPKSEYNGVILAGVCGIVILTLLW
jgi:hypothetical protein